MFIYINVTNREISTPQIFDTKDDAQSAMRKDFFEAIDADNDLIEKITAKLDNNETFCNEDDDFEIGPTSAYITDAPLTHTDWDAEIFEM